MVCIRLQRFWTRIAAGVRRLLLLKIKLLKLLMNQISIQIGRINWWLVANVPARHD